MNLFCQTPKLMSFPPVGDTAEWDIRQEGEAGETMSYQKGEHGNQVGSGGWEQVWDTHSRKKQGGKKPIGIQSGNIPPPLSSKSMTL